MWGSNYPPTGGNPYAANAYAAAGGYPPNSGPPPPPGAAPGGYGYGGYGAGGYGHPSAYNVNQYPGYPQGGGYGYGGGYGGGYSQAYAPQQPPAPYGGAPYGGGYNYTPGGGYAHAQGPAVPGFTAPAQYGGGQGPPPGGVPPSSHYSMMQNSMANHSMYQMQQDLIRKMGLVEMDDEEKEWKEEQERKMRRRRRNMDEEDEEVDMEEERRKMEERARKAEERAKELQEKLESDEGLKMELRERFVAELMRRQEVSGTFESTSGTTFPFKTYDPEDPVAKWFTDVKGDPIDGEDWDARYDAEFLRTGIRGWGTDEAAIMAVVSTRSNAQRHMMLREYKTCFGRDLIEDLKGDLSGKFRECMLALFESPARYDAWSIKKAIYGAGTNERALIEILMTRTNAQIQEMTEEYNDITYKKRHKGDSSIEADIRDDTSGDFKHLLVAIAQGNRRLIPQEKLEEAVVETTTEDGRWTGMFHVDYTKLLNMDRVAKRAQELFEAGQDTWGTDEETFIRVFATSDYYTMRAIWDEYVKVSQNDVMGAVDDETSGSFRKGLLAIAQNIRCRPMFFAERLYKSMKGLGTDDSTLIRICVSRSEIDMVQIKACFLEKYHKTLWKYIMEDTSGDYRKLLCSIVGKN